MKKRNRKMLCCYFAVFLMLLLLISNTTMAVADIQEMEVEAVQTTEAEVSSDPEKVSSTGAVTAINTAMDIEGHWAEKQITNLYTKGFVKGYSDNKFRPDNTITRAEFITIVNNVFGYKEKADISFNDVKTGDWFYEEIAKAVEAGYIKGYEDGTMKPQAQISRQEIAAVITNILRLQVSESSIELTKLSDYTSIQAWSKGAIGAVLDNGYMKGYTDKSFKAGNPIKRAEATVTLSNVAGSVYNTAGTFGDATVTENVTVTNDGVILQNLNINGNLYLTEGIGDGTVTLDNVTVSGNTLVCGCGLNSIIIINSTIG